MREAEVEPSGVQLERAMSSSEMRYADDDDVIHILICKKCT